MPGSSVFHRNHLRLSRRKCLVFMSILFVCLFIFSRETPPKMVYVLKGGLPIKRFAETSGEYDPAAKTKGHIALKVTSFVHWPQTQSWEPKVSDSVPSGNFRFPNCSTLIQGDPQAVQEARTFTKEHFQVTHDDMDYIRETRNCRRFVRDRGYILDASEEEKAFPLAFSLLFYKDLELTERLLRAVYRPHNVYCLHLDQKSSPSIHRAAEGLAACLDNVFLASTPINVQWGTFSVLEPELVCMKDLWAYKTWRYFINLTGQEYPLKTNLQLVQILTALNGSNDVDCTTSGVYHERWYNNFAAPHQIHPVKGSLHLAASRGFVDYMLHNRVAQDFLNWVNFTEFPDETFFSSLNHNPHLRVPGGYLGAPDTDANLKPYLSRFKNWGKYWEDGQGRLNFHWQCHGKRVRNICVFGLGDLPLLTARKEMFANKFHSDFEPLTLDCMEEWLWNMTMDEYSGRIKFDTSFYRNLDAARNHV